MDFSTIKSELENSTVETGNKYKGINRVIINGYIWKLQYLFKETNNFAGLNNYINENWEKDSSKIAYQSAVLGVAKHSAIFREMISGELDLIKSSNMKLYESREKQPKQIKTVMEHENWIDLKDLLKMRESEKYKNMPLQDQILFDFYTVIPPARLDYHNLKIVKNEFVDSDGLPEGVAADQNYLKMFKKSGRWKAKVVLKEFKTAESHGTIEFELPKKITDRILELKDHVYLFEKSGIKHKPFKSPETFANYLRGVFETVTDKKRMSVDMLRHIYITNFRKGEKSIAKKQELARVMGNSVAVQEEYRRIK